MKFNPGDTLDNAHCISLQHEFLRCDDAFKEFAAAATVMIMQGENIRIAYTAYNAYARFIHHLYEFMVGAFKRDTRNTRKAEPKIIESYLLHHAQRVLTTRREAILKGTAPSWENNISSFPTTVPLDFASKFRKCRNITLAHVTHERATLNLSDFYKNYHKYLYMLYYDLRYHWERQSTDFPALQEITKFSVNVMESSQD